MNGIKDAISRIVAAAMRLRATMKNYVDNGVDDNPLFEIWGDILDSIYALLEEHTETFEESVTYTVMTAPCLNNERRTKMLWAEYVKRHPEQPVVQPPPITISPEGMKEMMKRNGGYMTPEGDWK